MTTAAATMSGVTLSPMREHSEFVPQEFVPWDWVFHHVAYGLEMGTISDLEHESLCRISCVNLRIASRDWATSDIPEFVYNCWLRPFSLCFLSALWTFDRLQRPIFFHAPLPWPWRLQPDLQQAH